MLYGMRQWEYAKTNVVFCYYVLLYYYKKKRLSCVMKSSMGWVSFVVRLFILRFAIIRRPEALTPEPLSDATIRESTGERPVFPNKNKRMSVTRREKYPAAETARTSE